VIEAGVDTGRLLFKTSRAHGDELGKLGRWTAQWIPALSLYCVEGHPAATGLCSGDSLGLAYDEVRGVLGAELGSYQFRGVSRLDSTATYCFPDGRAGRSLAAWRRSTGRGSSLSCGGSRLRLSASRLESRAAGCSRADTSRDCCAARMNAAWRPAWKISDAIRRGSGRAKMRSARRTCASAFMRAALSDSVEDVGGAIGSSSSECPDGGRMVAIVAYSAQAGGLNADQSDQSSCE
jgi:hypothetical protein